MSALVICGWIAIAATVAFTMATFFGAGANTGSGQTRRGAIVEAWVNIAIGFSINFAANFAIFPLIGVHVSGAQNFWLGCIYTAVSVVRSFVIRRWFNARLVAFSRRISGA